MTDRDRAPGTHRSQRVETEAERSGLPGSGNSGDQHEFAVDATGGEPTEPTLEDVRSPERASGELGESAAGRDTVTRHPDFELRNRDAEPDRDETSALADPPTGQLVPPETPEQR